MPSRGRPEDDTEHSWFERKSDAWHEERDAEHERDHRRRYGPITSTSDGERHDAELRVYWKEMEDDRRWRERQERGPVQLPIPLPPEPQPPPPKAPSSTTEWEKFKAQRAANRLDRASGKWKL
jgi:hypothetical protein